MLERSIEWDPFCRPCRPCRPSTPGSWARRLDGSMARGLVGSSARWLVASSMARWPAVADIPTSLAPCTQTGCVQRLNRVDVNVFHDLNTIQIPVRRKAADSTYLRFCKSTYLLVCRLLCISRCREGETNHESNRIRASEY